MKTDEGDVPMVGFVPAQPGDSRSVVLKAWLDYHWTQALNSYRGTYAIRRRIASHVVKLLKQNVVLREEILDADTRVAFKLRIKRK